MNFQNSNSQQQSQQQSRPAKIQFINSNIVKKPNTQQNTRDKTIQHQKNLTQYLAQQQNDFLQSDNFTNDYQIQPQYSNKLHQNNLNDNKFDKKNQMQSNLEPRNLSQNTKIKIKDISTTYQNPKINIIARTTSQAPQSRNVVSNNQFQQISKNDYIQNQKIYDFTNQSQPIYQSETQEESQNNIKSFESHFQQQNKFQAYHQNEQFELDQQSKFQYKNYQEQQNFTNTNSIYNQQQSNQNYFQQNNQNYCLPERKSQKISQEVEQYPQKLLNNSNYSQKQQYSKISYQVENQNFNQNEQENNFTYNQKDVSQQIGERNDYQLSNYNYSQNYKKQNNSYMNNKYEESFQQNYPTQNYYEKSKPEIQYQDKINEENQKKSFECKSEMNQSVDLYESVCRDIIYKCERCQNPIEENCAQLKCYHSYHQQCLEELIQNQINQEVYKPIMCICGRKISESTIKYQLNQNNQSKLIQKYHQAQLIELFNKLQRKCNVQVCNICSFFCIQNKSQKQFQCFQHK